MENKSLISDDVILDTPPDELKKVSEEDNAEVLDDSAIKETEILPEGVPKDLILNKEEYAQSLREKLQPKNPLLANHPPIGISLSPDTPEEQHDQHNKVIDQALAEKAIQFRLKLENIMDENEPDSEKNQVETKAIEEQTAGAGGIPGGAAAAAGPATTTEGVALYKEKIGKFAEIYKRKKG